jgi:hypothetical protein
MAADLPFTELVGVSFRRGQKARVALVDQARLAEARKQLGEALGSLASFEVLTGESGEDEP